MKIAKGFTSQLPVIDEKYEHKSLKLTPRHQSTSDKTQLAIAKGDSLLKKVSIIEEEKTENSYDQEKERLFIEKHRTFLSDMESKSSPCMKKNQ